MFCTIFFPKFARLKSNNEEAVQWLLLFEVARDRISILSKALSISIVLTLSTTCPPLPFISHSHFPISSAPSSFHPASSDRLDFRRESLRMMLPKIANSEVVLASAVALIHRIAQCRFGPAWSWLVRGGAFWSDYDNNGPFVASRIIRKMLLFLWREWFKLL